MLTIDLSSTLVISILCVIIIKEKHHLESLHFRKLTGNVRWIRKNTSRKWTCFAIYHQVAWPACTASSGPFPSMTQYVDLLTCHTPHNVDTLPKLFSTYSWLNMSTCRAIIHHITSTLWPKCSLFIHSTTFY